MNTKPKEKILLVAIVLGVAAAVMIWRVLTSQQTSEARAQSVVVAATNIPVGTQLTADHLKIRSFPEKLVPPGAVTSREAAIDMKTKVKIEAGQPVFAGSLRKSGEQIVDLVPHGMRAVTVGLDPVIGVGGFLRPGNSVDVVATFEIDGTSCAKTVLQNVTLLAIGWETVQEGSGVSVDKSQSRVQPTATLAVWPADADKLILADAKGKLRLTLRGTLDKSIAPRKPITVSAVTGIASSKARQTSVPRTGSTGSTAFNLGPPPVFPVLPDSDSSLNPDSTEAPAATTSGKTITVVRGTEVSKTIVDE